MNNPYFDLFGTCEHILNKFSNITVGVVGDLIADVFIYGTPSQLSREAPVVIVKHSSQQVIPGGAGNTVNNLHDLGAAVIPLGLVGDDKHGDALVEYFRSKNIDVSDIQSIAGRHTITKMRVMAGRAHTSKQQVLRVDYDPHYHLTEQVEDLLIKRIDALAERVDGIIVSDYDYDLLTPSIVKHLNSVAQRKPVVVDSHTRLTLFKNIALATPNEHEALFAARQQHAENVDMIAVGQYMYDVIQPALGLLITMGNEGMLAFEKGHEPVHIPIVGSDDVTDVTGAGDTVVSVFTLAILAGSDFITAAKLANYAAALVVMKSGTATTNPDEILRLIRRVEYEQTSDFIYS